MGTAGLSVFSYLAPETDCFLMTPGDRVRASLGCLTTGLCCVLGDPISSSVLTENSALLLIHSRWSYLWMLVRVSSALLAWGLMACH